MSPGPPYFPHLSTCLCVKVSLFRHSVSQLTGELLEVIRCFSEAVPDHPVPKAHLDESSCTSSKSVGLGVSVCHPIAITDIHSRLNSFVEVRVSVKNSLKLYLSCVVDRFFKRVAVDLCLSFYPRFFIITHQLLKLEEFYISVF